MSANPKAVCIPCRKVLKGEGRRSTTEKDGVQKGLPYFPLKWMGTGAAIQWAPKTCPLCQGPTKMVSHIWRPPKRRDIKAWKRFEQGEFYTERKQVARRERDD